MAGIVDNLRKFRGYFDKETSNGSLWLGATLKPLKKFEDNFQVVSTDYDQYAILYTCTHLTSMYNKDSITVLVRQAPGIEEPSEELMETIRNEFDRIFGDQKANKQDKEAEEDQEAGDEEFLKEDEEEEAGAEEKEKEAGAEEKEKEAGAEEKEKEAGAEEKEKEAGAEEEQEKPDPEEEGAGQGQHAKYKAARF